MTHLLIDGDLLLYRAASATESEVQWDDDVWVLGSNLSESIDIFMQHLDSIKTALRSPKFTIVLSDAQNFRKSLTDTYKSSRKKTRKPLVFRPLRDFVIKEYPTITMPTLEADDVIGILATGPTEEHYVVVSDDKDMQTLPGITLWKSGGELRTISPEDAERFWMLQTLMGDSTDGYSGCPGIGPKTADKLLVRAPYWPSVVNTYRAAGLTEDDALLNARLARILRYTDWDHEKQCVKLWTPTTPL